MAEFTFDLAKLGGSFAGAENGQESGVTMPIKKVSMIGSEDDGPADFTLNLEKWMKGAKEWQKPGDKIDLETMQPTVEDANGVGDESVFAPLGTSTPAPDRRRQASIEDEAEEDEEDARPTTPPLTQHSTQTQQDKAAEEVFSQISALQEEVERLRLEAEDHQAEKVDLEQYRLQMEKEYDDLRHDLEDAKASVTGAQDKADANAESLETALQDASSQLASERKRADEGWQAAERAAQTVEKMEKAKADAEDKARLEEDEKRRGNLSKVTSLRAKFEPLAHELELVKAEAELAKQKADTKIATLEAKLKEAWEESATLRSQALDDQQVAAAEIEELRSELRKCRDELQDYQKASEAREQESASTLERLGRELQTGHETTANVTVLRMELENAQEQLSETRRILETVEDENDRFTQTGDRHQQDTAAQNASLNDALQQLEDKKTEIQEAKSTIEKLHAELERMKADKDNGASEEETRRNELAQLKTQHESALKKLQETHTATTQTLKATLLRAGRGMKTREQRLAHLHHSELTSLHHQLASHKTPDPDLRSAILTLSSKLHAAQVDLARTQQELVAAREEARDGQAANEAVNGELERRFKGVVEGREGEWRGRVRVLLRERERMAKVLLWGWGREEVGVGMGGGEEGGRQGYRYRFVER